MDSIIQHDHICLVCRTTQDIHVHHVFFGTANRKKSEEHGLKVYLCGRHHNMSNAGVHYNKTLDIKIKQLAQRKFEETHSRAEFMREFGRNWL